MSRPTRFLSNPSAYNVPAPTPIEPTPVPTPAPAPAAVEPTPAPAPAPAPVEIEADPIALDPIDVAPVRKPRAKKLPAAPAALPAVAE